jgi:hypothetical protein
MAHIVIITHAYDDFRTNNYLLRLFLGLWTSAGHRVSLTAGLEDWPEADIAILHVDLSAIPAAYAEASKRYAVVVNGAALDIRKNVVSRYLVSPGDDWDGPVVVKTDLNCRGMPELRKLRRAKAAGSQPDFTLAEHSCLEDPYPILPSIKDVHDAVWQNPGLVVERFLPEQDARGYWMRAWVFFGDRERCTRYLGSHPIIKSGNILAREPAAVPDEMRAERQRLGFDYGKFDFVVRDGKVILLDANRTPWAPPPPLSPELAASNVNLACGLSAFLRSGSRTDG